VRGERCGGGCGGRGTMLEALSTDKRSLVLQLERMEVGGCYTG